MPTAPPEGEHLQGAPAPRNPPPLGEVARRAGEGAFSAFEASADFAATPPTDRCAIASPTGGGS
ncbi:hypothetical protein DDF62_06215 [Caulobacter radicis]|nr:hypothetical protein DDF62_06215 [Caulobacter radicis]